MPFPNLMYKKALCIVLFHRMNRKISCSLSWRLATLVWGLTSLEFRMFCVEYFVSVSQNKCWRNIGVFVWILKMLDGSFAACDFRAVWCSLLFYLLTNGALGKLLDLPCEHSDVLSKIRCLYNSSLSFFYFICTIYSHVCISAMNRNRKRADELGKLCDIS